MTIHITDVYPSKAQFVSGESPSVWVELENGSGQEVTVTLVGDLMRGIDTVERREAAVRLQPNGVGRVLLTFSPREAEFEGYGVDVRLIRVDGEERGPVPGDAAATDAADCGQEGVGIPVRTHAGFGAGDEAGNRPGRMFSGAFDVVDSWRRSTRYGFLSDFADRDLGDTGDVELLNKFHVNLVQFYDWMYRHDELLPPTGTFTDPMGRTVVLDAVREKIALCHRFGMKAIAYGAVYAASREFFEAHRDWALYDSAGRALDFIGLLNIMNIAASCPWRDHIVGQYRGAVRELDFDGIHMDTYGYPKTAWSGRGDRTEIVRLGEHFAPLIERARQELATCKADIALIFNNVGNWPTRASAPAAQDAVYIEVWKPYERYSHIRALIDQAGCAGGGKPVILAAYLKPFRLEPAESIERAETAALLLTAVIVSGGGYHLLVGEQNGILTQGYYVDYSRAGDGFIRELRTYYDFMVRYAHVHYDRELQDVGMTHADGDNREYRFGGFPFSMYGEPGRVWVTVKEKPNRKVLHLINLVGCRDDLWNEGKERPARLERLTLRMQIDCEVKDVYCASPDVGMGRPLRPVCRIERGDRGMELVAEIPQLSIWTMLVVDFSDRPIADTVDTAGIAHIRRGG